MQKPLVPLCDLSRQAKALDDEIAAAMQRVHRSGRYILGPRMRTA